MSIRKGIYRYQGEVFEIVQTSPEAATVGLKCGKHEHRDFIVGLLETETGWAVGRKESGHRTGDSFAEAVEHGAAMLLEECKAISQIDEFFAGQVDTVRERLESLAAFLPDFESPGFEFGHMATAPGGMPYYNLSAVASRFVHTCYKMGWVQNFDWVQWKDSPEATELLKNPAAMELATPDQLGRLLTAIIRQDRFAEGALGAAFDSGLLIAILRRIAALAADHT